MDRQWVTLMQECSTFWGETTVAWSDPIVETARNAMFFPFDKNIFFDHDPNWGVYSENGSLIRAAAYLRGPGSSLVGQSESLDSWSLPSEKISCSGTHYIYGGPVIPHFGHWLLSSICRYWPLIRRRTRPFKIVCHASNRPAEWFGVQYIKTILNALELSADDFFVPESPVIFERLEIPYPSFIEQHAAHRAYGDLCRFIGDKIIAQNNDNRNKSPIYISKTKLKHGVSRLKNEIVLESFFEDAGFQIIYPESLSFVEQLNIFNSETPIIGMAGSAFHLSVFSRAHRKLFLYTPEKFVNSNFKLLDIVGEIESKYIDISKFIIHEGSDDCFNSNYILDKPERIASELIDAIR